MSAQPGEPEVVELPAHGDAAFGALMDALAPDEDLAKGAAGAAAAAPAEGQSGQAVPDGAAAGAAGATGGAGADADLPSAGELAGAPAGGAPAGGAAGTGAATDAGDTSAAGGADGGRGGTAPPESWTAAAADLVPKFGELSTKFEENVAQGYQETALAEVRTEHAQYFEALEKHPRLLVGTQVPAIGKEGTETLRDTNDAREWQEAVKGILVEEVRGRAQKEMDDNGDFLTTVHASIELFQNNVDLIPGTKDFDVDLANRFTSLAAPYELRVEGKLQGYSIPVQGLIDNVRKSLAAERVATATVVTPGGTPAGSPAPATSTPPVPDPPQAGIGSKAGSSDQREDFSTLFGTLGLPNLQI